MRFSIAALLTAFLALLMAGPALSQGEGRKVALVIGNAAYQHANPLRNPVNDSRAIAGMFQELGFDVRLVLDADRNTLTAAIGDFSQQATDADVAVLYYAGHGLSLEGRNFLVPVDSDIQRAADVRLGAALDAEVAIEQALAGAKVKLVFLDACRNNPFVDQIKRSLGTTRASSVVNGLSKMDSGDGTLIAFSTAPGQTALDGSGALSPFAEAMLKDLAEPGLEVRLAMTKVRADVEAITGNQQTPWESTNLTGFFYFRPVVAAPTPAPSPAAAPNSDTVAALDLEYWKSVKDSAEPALFEAYLLKFPQGVYRALAEARIKQLAQQAGPKTDPAATVEKPEVEPAPPPPVAIPEPDPPKPLVTKSPVKSKPERQKSELKKTPVKPVSPDKGSSAKAAGTSADALYLSKNIRLNSGVWSVPPGATKLGPRSFTRNFGVVYKGRSYACHALGMTTGSNRVTCSAK